MPNINFSSRSRCNPLLNTIPVSCEKSDLLEFALGPEPIVKLIAWEVATLKIDFKCATPDFFLTWYVAYGCLVCLMLERYCVNL
jgi:hypothetical protein